MMNHLLGMDPMNQNGDPGMKPEDPNGMAALHDPSNVMYMTENQLYPMQNVYQNYMYEQKHSYMPDSNHQPLGGQMFDMQGIYGHLQSPTTSNQSMSPSPPPPPRVYKPCAVCSDKSSGYHYGISSCEGCKGFFRRSVQKNMQYTCHKDENCPINKVTRNRCQYCRLQKCFQSGMSREAVRNDRNKKRKMKAESSSSSSSTSQVDKEELSNDDHLLILELLQAHQTTEMSDCGTDAKIKKETPDDGEKAENTPIWDKVSELSSDGIVKIVEFSKKVPGFLKIKTPDQVTLLKAACLEMMILRLCSRYNVTSDTMMFPNGVQVSREQLRTGGFGSLTDTIFKFALSLHNMSVDDTEVALLAAICLLSADRSGLHDSEIIEEMQSPFLKVLESYMRSRRTVQLSAFPNLLVKLADLRSISVKGAERILHLRLEMPGELPPLILEMLDRAENVCIP